MLKIKIVSGMVKPFLDESIDNYSSLKRISALRGERLTLQVLYTYCEGEDGLYRGGVLRDRLEPRLSGSLARYARLHQIKSVAVYKPKRKDISDDGFLRSTPGLYPDLLLPMTTDGRVRPEVDLLEALLLDIEIPDDDASVIGEGELRVSFVSPSLDGRVLAEDSVNVEVVNAILPKQKLIYTQWFHYDCLAHYYDVPMWSDRHLEIVESFVRVAVKNGINMLLTPVFTPPLDTAKGGERLTAQLVTVTKEKGEYTFDYSLLDRFIEMCDRAGVEYFEISHLFTQGGAANAPKIMGYENGEYKRLFGWETLSSDSEYHKFLIAFTGDFISHMKARGDDKRCYFHVSDEPNGEHLETYKMATAVIKTNLSDYKIMDAMSDFSFYSEGILDNPVVYLTRIDPFLEAGVKGLWAYYCGQPQSAGNMIAMPSSRTRSIGLQLYTDGIVGFLQWGYNFYNNCDSLYPVIPFIEASGENWVPAGDPFTVYPGIGGKCLESLRIIAFKSGIDDMRALELCESLYGREKVLSAIENTLGYKVDHAAYVKTADEMLRVREVINKMIKDSLN